MYREPRIDFSTPLRNNFTKRELCRAGLTIAFWIAFVAGGLKLANVY